MGNARVKIYKTGSPAGWAWIFDVTSTPNDSIDNFGTAANPNAAMDAIKPLFANIPGTLSEIDMTIRSYEAP